MVLPLLTQCQASTGRPAIPGIHTPLLSWTSHTILSPYFTCEHPGLSGGYLGDDGASSTVFLLPDYRVQE